MIVGLSVAACSGSVTGTDLTAGDGGAGGGGGGGLLGGGGLGGGNNNGGGTAQGGGLTGTEQNGTAPAPAPSSTGTGTGKAGVCGGSESTGSAACDACLTQSCCASIKACDGNPECLAEWKCMIACNGDSECGQDCRVQHPAGDNDLKTFVGCLQNCGACQ